MDVYKTCIGRYIFVWTIFYRKCLFQEILTQFILELLMIVTNTDNDDWETEEERRSKHWQPLLDTS